MGKSSGNGLSFPNSYNDVLKINAMQRENLRHAAALSARYGFFNQFTPFGSQQFVGTPGTPGFRSVQKLPPREQEFLQNMRRMRLGMQRLGQQQLGAAGGILGMPIGGPESFADTAAEVERATFERGRNLLEPGFEQERERLENQLVQRGLPRAGEAFTTEQENLAQRQNQALENLALSSVGAGRQEQSRLLQSELARRSGILGELGALGMNVQPLPQFGPTPQIGVGAANINDPLALATQVQSSDLARRQAAQQAGKGGAVSLLGSAGKGLGGFFGGKG